MAQTRKGAKAITEKRRGRKPHAAQPGGRVSLGLKVTPEIKNKLDEATKHTGRTQSQETEVRLEESFRNQALLDQVLELAYGRELAGVLMMVGRAMRVTGQVTALASTSSYDDIDHWLRIPHAVNQAISAAVAILEACRPPGRREFPDEIKGGRSTEEVRGLIFADQILRAVKHPGCQRVFADVSNTLGEAHFVEQPNPDLNEFAKKVHALLGNLVEQITLIDIQEIRRQALEGMRARQ